MSLTQLVDVKVLGQQWQAAVTGKVEEAGQEEDLVLGPGELEEAGLGAGDVEQQRLSRTKLQLKVSDLSHKLHCPHQTKSVYEKVC